MRLRTPPYYATCAIMFISRAGWLLDDYGADTRHDISWRFADIDETVLPPWHYHYAPFIS